MAMADSRLVRRFKICEILIKGLFLMAETCVWFWMGLIAGCLFSANVGCSGGGESVGRDLVG